MGRLRLDTIVTLNHINTRKVGPDDDKELMIDVRVDAMDDMTVPDHLDPALRHFLWMPDGNVRSKNIKAVEFTNEEADCTIRIAGMRIDGVRLKKFSVEARNEWCCWFQCTLVIRPTGTQLATLSELLDDGMKLWVRGAPNLFDGSIAEDIAEDEAWEVQQAMLRAEAGEPDLVDQAQAPAAPPPMTPIDALQQAVAQPAPVDELLPKAEQLVREHKRASISLVQRHLGIGYNRAARLMESLEAKGAVSPAGADGNRTVLGGAA